MPCGYQSEKSGLACRERHRRGLFNTTSVAVHPVVHFQPGVAHKACFVVGNQRVAVAVFVGCADWAIGHGGLCIKRGDQDVVQQARLLFDSSRPNHAVDPEVKMLF